MIRKRFWAPLSVLFAGLLVVLSPLAASATTTQAIIGATSCSWSDGGSTPLQIVRWDDNSQNNTRVWELRLGNYAKDYYGNSLSNSHWIYTVQATEYFASGPYNGSSAGYYTHSWNPQILGTYIDDDSNGYSQSSFWPYENAAYHYYLDVHLYDWTGHDCDTHYYYF